MAFAICLCVSALPWCNAQETATDKRAPIPDQAACASAEMLIKDLFKDQYALHSPADHRRLAVKLFRQADEPGNDAAARFVLLREAGSLALEAGDLGLALSAGEYSAHQFQVDALECKSQMLANPPRSVDQREVAVQLLGLAREAMRADRVDLAGKTALEASVVASKSRDSEFASEVRAAGGWFANAANLAKDADAAKIKIGNNFGDPDDYLTVGRFSCFTEVDWSAGLPYLAKGSDSVLRTLAARDVAAPTDANEMVALADDWWDLPDNEFAGAEASSGKRRAAYWYSLAIPNLTGLKNIQAQKRNAELAATASGRLGESINFLALIDPDAATSIGNWKWTSRGLSCGAQQAAIQIPYTPPLEYDIHAAAARDRGNDTVSLAFRLQQGWTTAAIGSQGNKEMGITDIKNNWYIRDGRKAGIQNGQVYQIVVKVRRNRVTAYVDDQLVADLETDGKGMSLGRDPKMDNFPIMELRTSRALATFSRLELLEISGKGRVISKPASAPMK